MQDDHHDHYHPQDDDDIVVIQYKPLAQGGFVFIASDGRPIKAVTHYQELEHEVTMMMRRASGHLPNILQDRQNPPPLRDAFPTQPAQPHPQRPIPFHERAMNLVSRATR